MPKQIFYVLHASVVDVILSVAHPTKPRQAKWWLVPVQKL
jgi:hypothetical protein